MFYVQDIDICPLTNIYFWRTTIINDLNESYKLRYDEILLINRQFYSTRNKKNKTEILVL